MWGWVTVYLKGIWINQIQKGIKTVLPWNPGLIWIEAQHLLDLKTDDIMSKELLLLLQYLPTFLMNAVAWKWYNMFYNILIMEINEKSWNFKY